MLKHNIFRNHNKSFVVAICIFLLSFTVDAQRYYFEQFSLAEGLPHSEVFDIIQSKDSKIWVATEGGVAIFNGHSFNVLTTEDGLLDNDIVRLLEDQEGRIWICSEKGDINYFFKDSIYQVPQLMRKTNSLRIYDIVESKDGTLYFGTADDIVTYNDGIARSIFEGKQMEKYGVSSMVIF
ncbi:MAG: two-component regulator propeller domain-containing protein, partial [Bacteroidota bacterium]